MKDVGTAILAAQPILGGRGVEDRDGAGFGQARDRQQFWCRQISHDQADALRSKVAESCSDIAVFRDDAFDQFEGLASKVPGRIVVGDAEPRALYSLILRGLIEIGERQGPLDCLRQPADPDCLIVGLSAHRSRRNDDEKDQQDRSAAA